MNFQVFSDLHLELNVNLLPLFLKPCAPYLILAGDIGNSSQPNFQQWIQYCSDHWDQVFFVCGNHEFYRNRSMTHVLGEIRALFAQTPNVHLLDNSFVELPNYVTIYGFTGWTPLPLPHTHPKTMLHDFSHIRTVEGPWRVATQNKTSHRDLMLFRNFLTSCASQHIVVVTHFPPIRWHTDVNDPPFVREYYAWSSMLDRELADLSREKEKIKLWCSGHVHQSHDVVQNGIRFVSNPMGYEDERNPNFNVRGNFELVY